eukprot:2393862-Pyramimonas_sp.AAC.1
MTAAKQLESVHELLDAIKSPGGEERYHERHLQQTPAKRRRTFAREIGCSPVPCKRSAWQRSLRKRERVPRIRLGGLGLQHCSQSFSQEQASAIPLTSLGRHHADLSSCVVCWVLVDTGQCVCQCPSHNFIWMGHTDDEALLDALSAALAGVSGPLSCGSKVRSRRQGSTRSL